MLAPRQGTSTNQQQVFRVFCSRPPYRIFLFRWQFGRTLPLQQRDSSTTRPNWNTIYFRRAPTFSLRPHRHGGDQQNGNNYLHHDTQARREPGLKSKIRKRLPLHALSAGRFSICVKPYLSLHTRPQGIDIGRTLLLHTRHDGEGRSVWEAKQFFADNTFGC